MRNIITVVACLVAVVSAHSLGTTKEEIIASAKARVHKCSEENHISAETVAELYKTEQFSGIEPTENIKCFTKCVTLSFDQVTSNNDIDEDSVIAVSLAYGKEEAQVRAKLDSCKTLNSGLKTCDDFFKAFLCYEKA